VWLEFFKLLRQALEISDARWRIKKNPQVLDAFRELFPTSSLFCCALLFSVSVPVCAQ
jgi:hypothetical protein